MEGERRDWQSKRERERDRGGARKRQEWGKGGGGGGFRIITRCGIGKGRSLYERSTSLFCLSSLKLFGVINRVGRRIHYTQGSFLFMCSPVQTSFIIMGHT